ncbi:MAG TPA: DUF3488 and transglutaminase-like domain-containing protein, partial [Microthrixaceae bacterium]|nr:DUF3488 and transglutaminase-like domain-containing protein [Microthrixaceae bacterium]
MNQIPGSQTNTNQASTSQTSANQATAGNGVPTALAAPTKTAARGTRWRRTIGPNDSKDSWGALLVAELGLLALGLGTLAGFCRLFDGWDFFVPLATITLGSWMAALVLRRTRIPMTIAAPVHIVLGVIAIGAMFVPESTILGAPVPAAFSAAVSEVTSSFTEIRTMVPPVEATTGFLIVIAAGFWLLALYADTAALRVDAVIQAAAPYLVTFLAVGIPSNGPDRLIGISSFVAGLVIYAAAIQFRRYSGLSWADRSPAVGARSVALTATGIAVAGAIVALIAGAALPTQDRRIDLREIGKGPGARTVVSPFVGVTTLLGTRSNSEMFRVRADKPSYWRLTALGSFDEERNIWISHDTYSPINGDIARSTPLGVPTNRLRQDYKISGLSGPWLPAAFEPGRISGEASATHDPMSASLIVDEESSSSLSYRVDSFLPDLEPVSEKLNTSSKQSGPSTLDPELLRVPALSLELRRAFDNATALGTNPYQKMVLLQDWFRSEFIYDEGVNYSGSGDPTTDFIEARRGFCQQFSSTFALLARHAGLPSRVAV